MTSTLVRPAAPTAPAAGRVAAYGLGRPTVVDARVSVERIFRADADRVWTELTAPVVGRRAAVTVEEVVAAMAASADDVVRLCGEAMSIRLRS